ALPGEIIGGWEAWPHSRPYMAFVNIDEGGGSCGGFLIREDVVVTAAHCNCNLGSITVLLGAHNVEIDEPDRQEIQVHRRIQHPDYNDETLHNDIMLLQLEDEAELNKRIDLIPLPLDHQPVPPETVCSVAGWGRTSADSELLSDTLQEVDVEVMLDTDCLRIRNGPYHHYNPSTVLCVGDPHEGKDSAQGDSGGPLVCEKKAHSIVSWGRTDGNPPGVYTRVSTFVPWIEKTMKKLHP
ncbi:mast cell protease 3-like, partial [Emydura macquarii macquarii]|uniref:mast cell protease 3-like n=1 Tax=Emydura macquarii macquarii TaxID=1129001 RepID=UPI00352A6302